MYPSLRFLFKAADFKTDLEAAREATDTNPSEAQISAGNQRKGKVTVRGLTISIENPKGSVRSGKDKGGKAWSITLKSDYGYFLGTKACDGDHVDVFLGEDPEHGRIWVIDQHVGGKYDEPKVIFGAADEEDARKTYLANYTKGWDGIGKITEMTEADLKEWLKAGAPELGGEKKAAAAGAIERMLQREGGTDKVITDSGGVTRGGIAESRGTHTAAQIRALDGKQIRDIWKKDWDGGPAHFPNAGAGEVFYDIQGNAGKPRATMWLQESLNKLNPTSKLPITGNFGPQTRGALAGVDQAALARELLARQKSHHEFLTTGNPGKYKRYQEGWASRRAQLESSPLIHPLLDPNKRVAPVVPQSNGAVKVKGIPPKQPAAPPKPPAPFVGPPRPGAVAVK